MRATKKMAAILLLVIMVILPVASAIGEGAIPGGFTAPGGDTVFFALRDAGDVRQYSLYSIKDTGGDMTFIESYPYVDDSLPSISDLLYVNDNLYYLRFAESYFQIVRRDYLGSSEVVIGFNPGAVVKQLSFYEGMLYFLIDDILHLADPATGEYLPVGNGTIGMEEYVIADRMIYYVSSEDKVTYTKVKAQTATEAAQTLTTEAGRLYSLTMAGENPERVTEVGVRKVQVQGDQIYFYNLDDNYITGRAPAYWLEGKPHRMDLTTHVVSSMKLDYAWDYYATPNGFVRYCAEGIWIYPLLGGTGQLLMEPTGVTVLFAVDSDLYVFERNQEVNNFVKLPLNGQQAVQLVGGAMKLGESEILSIEDGFEDDPEADALLEEGEADTDTDSTVTATTKPTTKPTDGSYIFKDSNTKKLTRKRILAIDQKLWPYARNEIYARHGYSFKTKKYRDYFGKKSWYKSGGFSTGKLNSTEWYNMDLIKALEAEFDKDDGSSGGGSSTATDSSYIFKNSGKKKLTEKQVKSIKKSLRPYARNEILARHGYVFETKKYADYFKKKTWYKPGGYSSSKLSSIEWYNIDLIKKFE